MSTSEPLAVASAAHQGAHEPREVGPMPDQLVPAQPDPIAFGDLAIGG
jgi:hypothetical protein